jgi:peptide/nickel transport system substrate-binding protein
MEGHTMTRCRRWLAPLSLGLLLFAWCAPADAAPEGRAAAPEGQLTWAVHTTLVPAWFDPVEMPSVITPFMILYGLHDALVKPMPGQAMAPSLAESWSASKDGLVYEFVLRKGVRFHNGDPLTAEDVKFSFERYRGVSAKLLKDRVAAVETPDPGRVRFRLKAPWPDFMMFYSSATGSGWVMPKKYVDKVGDEGFKKAPVGAGPYKFVSFNPGVELVLEAFDGYWRKAPNVKRLVFRVIPDEATRLAALKRGEADIAYAMSGEIGREIQRSAGLALKPTVIQSTHFAFFADQFDPKSPWHDRRVRLAANLSMDRNAINQAISLGNSKVTGSVIPSTFDFYWQPPPIPRDQARAKQLLAEAGYPNGFDAGDYNCDVVACGTGEPVVNDFKSVGIALKIRPLERAAFFKGFAEKKLKNVIHVFGGVFGNAATRLEAFVVSGGTYAYGAYPDLDGLFRDQAAELDRAKRETLLHRMQQIVHERAMFAPIYELAFLNGVGPRVEESGLGLIAGYAYSAPYEDLKLKAK